MDGEELCGRGHAGPKHRRKRASWAKAQKEEGSMGRNTEGRELARPRQEGRGLAAYKSRKNEAWCTETQKDGILR